MGDWFLGEIRIFSGYKIPTDWVACNGQLLSINSNAALYSVLGTQYGGDGKTTFALPDLRGRAVIGLDPSSLVSEYYTVGGRAGTQSVTLTPNQVPSHTHALTASTDTTSPILSPNGNYIGVAQKNTVGTTTTNPTPIYAVPATGTSVPLSPSAMTSSGGSKPHENRQPFLVLQYCIATSGLYPPRF